MTSWAQLIDKLNARLLPYIGPPPLGPYDEAPLPPTGAKPCPVCGNPMDAHTFDRLQGHAPSRMHCPR
ncbi:hypothetical protein [Galbitalea soli]|uniref:Uncharacterized protein n=1 Tax=Galbitalea soli TaxID=1268042 RepID=A0A7C9TST0_9MICO|nr:hypothetical protein [Galbitalea soli]NEM92435.1 hypothetical protein [Galbitalea soli]NYJ29470.1 hypothetical protein [Galbitalea soli]